MDNAHASCYRIRIERRWHARCQRSAGAIVESASFLIPAGIVVAIVVAIVALVYWWLVGRFMQSTDDAYLQADSVTIAPKVSGYVTDVYVGDNVSVKAGDPLVRLDSRQYQAALDQAQATIDARKADILRAQAGVPQQRAAIEQAKAQQQVAALNSRHAEDEVRRYGPLATTGAESGDQLSVLTTNRDQARATLAADTAALDQAQARMADLDAQLAQARAQLEAAQASARQTQLDLQDTVIRSSLSGRVGDRTVRVGQYVQPGTRMMTVVPVQSIYLTANFKETQVGRMRAGQPARLHVDALSDADLHGVVDSFVARHGLAVSPCCRLKTRPAISPRSCSACRCAFASMPTNRRASCWCPACR